MPTHISAAATLVRLAASNTLPATIGNEEVDESGKGAAPTPVLVS